MTNKRFRDIIESLGLNQTQAAHVLGLKLRAVHGYTKTGKIPMRVQLQLAYLTKYGTDLAHSIVKGK